MQCKNCQRYIHEWCEYKKDSPDPEIERECEGFATVNYKALVDKAREIDEKATPGPWMWDLRECNHQCLLTTTHSGKYYVMGFQRWGLQDALPSFQVYDRYEGDVKERGSRGMVRAEKLSKSYPGKEHHYGFDNFIDHPDARYIAESRELFHLMTAAITDLLARAESAEARADKAEKERDEAATLLNYIYYQECVVPNEESWIKDVIARWRGQKED